MSKTKTMFLLAALLSANLLAWVQTSMARRDSTINQLDLLVNIRQRIIHGYVEKPDESKLIEAAARAMVESLEDPFSVYLSPEEQSQFDKQVKGTFSGIGAEIDAHEGRIRIVTPMEESPAWKAGVLAGDIILEIDGTSTLDMKVTDAVGLLTGPEGTTVTIKVRHPSGEEATFPITRARINVHTTRGAWRNQDQSWNYMLDPQHKIGYIRLTQFSDGTSDEMAAALNSLLKQDVKGLILDLRFNPGGRLDKAVEVSDMFLPAGKRIVSTKGRMRPEQVFMSTSRTLMPDTPLVVLINEGSASAAEIVSGALLDNDRAQIIGTRSFGKGSVQQVMSLGDEMDMLNPGSSGKGALKLTEAYYYLPNGRNIHRRPNQDTWGVDPRDGFYVPMNSEEIRKMISVRREGDVVRASQEDRSTLAITPQWIQENLHDAQLAAAVKALVGKLETDSWPVVGVDGVQTHELAARREALERQAQMLQDRLEHLKREIARLDDTPPGAATQPAEAGNIKGTLVIPEEGKKPQPDPGQ